MTIDDLNIPTPEMVKAARNAKIIASLNAQGILNNLGKIITDSLSDRDSANLKFPKLSNAEMQCLVGLLKNHGYEIGLQNDFEEDATVITIYLP